MNNRLGIFISSPNGDQTIKKKFNPISHEHIFDFPVIIKLNKRKREKKNNSNEKRVLLKQTILSSGDSEKIIFIFSYIIRSAAWAPVTCWTIKPQAIDVPVKLSIDKEEKQEKKLPNNRIRSEHFCFLFLFIFALFRIHKCKNQLKFCSHTNLNAELIEANIRKKGQEMLLSIRCTIAWTKERKKRSK